MLYVAHLAFTSPDPDAAHGYLTTLIEADSIDSAITGTRDHLSRLQRERSLFSPGTEVTVASCVEIRSLSRDGFVMQFWRLSGADFSELSSTLLDADDHEAVAFQWCQDDPVDSRHRPALLLAVPTPAMSATGSNGVRDGPE